MKMIDKILKGAEGCRKELKGAEYQVPKSGRCRRVPGAEGCQVLCVVFFALCAMLTGCTDSNEPAKEGKTPEGMVKVSFKLPKGGFESRAYDAAKEGYMSNLYVVAVKTGEVDDNGSITGPTATPEITCFRLDPTGYATIVGREDYQEYDINLYPGLYRFYVLSNLDLYLGDLNTTVVSYCDSEESLKNMVLTYSDGTPLTPGHLPMACFPYQIKVGGDLDSNIVSGPGNNYGGNYSYTDYTVKITKGGDRPEIYADMNFICAKVRVTILFNVETISSDFKDSDGRLHTIRFYADDYNLPYADVIRQYNRVDRNVQVEGFEGADGLIHQYLGTGDLTSHWSFQMDRYYYPTNPDGSPNDNYPNSPEDELTPWDKTVAEWVDNNKEQRAWQGIVYLPENDMETNRRTVLNFPYVYDESSYKEPDRDENGIIIPGTGTLTPDGTKQIFLFGGNVNAQHYLEGTDGTYSNDREGHITDATQQSTHGIERHMMYDVVARVKTPESSIGMQIYIKIRQWNYNKYQNDL